MLKATFNQERKLLAFSDLWSWDKASGLSIQVLHLQKSLWIKRLNHKNRKNWEAAFQDWSVHFKIHYLLFIRKKRINVIILIFKTYCKKKYHLSEPEVYIIYCSFSSAICIRINIFLNSKINTIHGSGIFISLKRCSAS